MNIYLVERTDSWSYDDHDSFVCYAENDEQAKHIYPDEFFKWTEVGWRFGGNVNDTSSTGHSWVNDLSLLNVTELGKTEKEVSPGVILASYNAG